ncbi:MAG: EamA family transporter [Patescibacteria group bacterium]
MIKLFVVFLSPLLYATTNHIDKYLISKHLHDNQAGSLIIFSSVFAVVALPVVWLIQPTLLSVSLGQGLLLSFSGAIVVMSLLCYFYSIQKDEATFVVPFYQTVPIFGYILGYFLLNEQLTKHQIYASLIILCGALILSFDLVGPRPRFKKEVVWLMLLASLGYAVSGVVFKLVAQTEGFWVSVFWSLIGKLILGGLFLLFITNYRRQFFDVLKNSGPKILGLNSLNETITIVADGIIQYASLLAPLALVLLANSLQPFFVFIIGLGLTLFFPRISQEIITPKIITQKLVGIGLVVLGGYWLG